MDGIFIVNKEAGMTSHDVVSIMRKILNTHKIGHGGTLDPMATGVLPIFVGRATRFLEYALYGDKAYRATLFFGAQTDTGDAQGKVIARSDVRSVSAEEWESVFERFLGKGEQIPPMYSALKYNGQKLYKLARKGIEVPREARPIEIFSLRAVSCDATSLVFDVECSKGTYVRKLGEELAEACGMAGHLGALSRTRVGAYTIEASHSLAELRADYRNAFIPMERAIEHLPRWQVNDLQGMRIAQGVPTTMPNIAEGTIYAVFTDAGMCIGLAEARGGRLQAKKIINIPEGMKTAEDEVNHES